MKKILFIVMLLPMVALAQNLRFEESNQSFVGLVATSPLSIDVNGDSIPDLFLNGYDTSEDEVKALFYTNDGNANFTLSGISVEEFSNGAAVAEDFDNDGDEDLLYSGINFTGNVFEYYENLGNGNFSNKPCNNALSVLGLYAVTISVADTDQDGDLDVFIFGNDGVDAKAYLLLNDGTGCFSVSTQVFTGAHGGGSVLIDFNNDGFPDLFNFGTRNQQTITEIRLNINGIFGDPITGTGIPLIFDGKVAAAYLNDDQYIDLVYAADSNSEGHITKVCFGNGDGTFNCEEQSFPQVAHGSVFLEDFDGDEDIDAFINGKLLDGNETRVSKLFLNDGFGNFSNSGIAFTGFFAGKAVAIHANNDSDLDIFISGEASVGFPSTNPISKLYINTTNLSVDDFSVNSLKIYPNPTTGIINLNLPANSDAFQVTITDMIGRNIPVILSNGQINISNFSNGIYLVSINTGTQMVTKRIIKQ
jgi:hypothetical protein